MINPVEEQRIQSEAEERAIVSLIGHAQTSVEHHALLRVAKRAGLIWTCPTCREPNYATATACCGTTRPTGEATP